MSSRDLRSLKALGAEGLVKRLVCVCLEQRPRRVDNIDVLERLWEGAYRD
ncbi:MAG: hypothetical protein AB1758_23265 [Candidatus Eremiobacterota bacterium]